MLMSSSTVSYCFALTNKVHAQRGRRANERRLLMVLALIDDLTAQLQSAVEVGLTGADCPEGRGADVVVRLAKDRMVEEIKAFCTEFESFLAPDGKRANDSGIQIDPSPISL
jgi:hypothetical protein